MSDAKKQVLRRWLGEMWGGGNLALVDQLVTPDYVYRATGLPETRGPEALKGMVTMFRTAFPDLTASVEEQVAEGDVVVTRGMASGTHRGPMGEMAATGRTVAFPFILISRFEGDRIADEFEVYDAMGMMQQLGAIPTQG